MRWAAAIGLLIGGGPAAAQPASESPTETPVERKPTVIREIDQITVLGSSDEARQLVPGSGQYLDRDTLRIQSQDDILRILSQVPGVYLRQEDGNGLFPNISLRGVDSTRSAKVTVMEDGILAAPAPYSAPAAYYSPSAGRMEGIEVLKGSSQIRNGPHTTGGVLNYISTSVPAELDLYGKLLYGDDHETRLHTYAGQTFDTRSAGSFGVLAELYLWRSDGWRTIDASPDFQDVDNTGFTTIEPMVKLQWVPPTERAQRFDFKFGYTDGDALETYLGLSEDDFASDVARRYTTTRFDQITRTHYRVVGDHFIELPALTDQGPPVELVTRGYWSRFERNWRKLEDILAVDVDDDDIPDTGQGANLARALAGDGTRTGANEILTPNSEGKPLELLRGMRAGILSLRNNDRKYQLFGAEQKATLPVETGPVMQTIEVGWRFHQDEIRRFQRDEILSFGPDGSLVGYAPGTGGDGGNRYQRTQALALHLEDVIEVGDFTIRPGVRFEQLWQRAIDYALDDTNTVVREGEATQSLVGGGVGATWQTTDSIILFAGVHSGFSPANPRSAIFQGVTNERSYAGEAGARFEWPDLALSAEATGFFTRFEDLIVIDSVGGAGTGDAENVGEVNSGGLETQVAWDPASLFDVRFEIPTSLSYTYTSATLANDARSNDPNSIFACGVQGNRVPYIPEHSLAFSIGFQMNRFGVNASVTHTSEQFSTASNTDSLTTPEGIPDSRFGVVQSNTLLDLIGWFYVDRDQRIKLIAGVHNVTDSAVVVTRHPIGPRANKPRWAYGGVELAF